MAHSSVSLRSGRIIQRGSCIHCHEATHSNLSECESCAVKITFRPSKRRRDDDTVMDQDTRERAKRKSEADLEPVVIVDTDIASASEYDDYDNSESSDSDSDIDIDNSGDIESESYDSDGDYNEGHEKSLKLSFSLNYPPPSTSVAYGSYATAPSDAEVGMDAAVQSPVQDTSLSTSISTEHKPNLGATSLVGSTESKSALLANVPNETELISSLTTTMRFNDQATTTQWLKLQKEMHKLVHADSDREIQRLRSAERGLARHNRALRREIRSLKGSKDILQRQVQAMEERLRAKDDEHGRTVAEADREKMQMGQTIRDMKEEMQEYRRIREAMMAIK